MRSWGESWLGTLGRIKRLVLASVYLATFILPLYWVVSSFPSPLVLPGQDSPMLPSWRDRMFSNTLVQFSTTSYNFLDIFLPRVAELADTSSDRRTKVAACELLHSLVLYLVGRGAGQLMVSTDVKSTMAPLYSRLLPVMMRLSCDVEQVLIRLYLKGPAICFFLNCISFFLNFHTHTYFA